MVARILALIAVLAAHGCGDSGGPNSCQLSGGCDFIVSSADECPDPINNPGFCTGVCGGGECCWCEGGEPQVLFIDCFDCADARVPDAASPDAGADAGGSDAAPNDAGP